jgi:hypothetical protein
LLERRCREPLGDPSVWHGRILASSSKRAQSD